MILEQGQTIYRTQGEYSTFGIGGFYRALRTFDSEAALSEFVGLGKWPKKWQKCITGSYGADETHWYGADDDFMQWLVSEMYLESCDQEFTGVWCDSGGNHLVFEPC